MNDPRDVAESLEARVATLEQQTQWLSIELARIRSLLESLASVASEALLSEPEE